MAAQLSKAGHNFEVIPRMLNFDGSKTFDRVNDNLIIKELIWSALCLSIR